MLQIHIQKELKDRYQIASKYYRILFLLNEELKLDNDLTLTLQEINILAFAAVMGELSTIKARTQAMRYFNISRYSLNNAISKLQRAGVLVKTDKSRVIPSLQLDFTKDILIKLELSLGQETVMQESNG